MANATWPSDLPDWRIPTSDQSESGVLRTEMDAGPNKVRRRYSAVPSRFQTSIVVDGDERGTLENFFHNTLGEGALKFNHTDPTDDSTQEFRFLAPPSFEMQTGGDTYSDRVWNVQLKIERMP